jgi:hypothetical protein
MRTGTLRKLRRHWLTLKRRLDGGRLLVLTHTLSDDHADAASDPLDLQDLWSKRAR